MTDTAETIGWLLAGDPAIRWQVQRDLLGKARRSWQAERARTVAEGWGADLLARQDANGGWGGGDYSPKWTSTTYTLLTLCDIGVPGANAAARRGAARVVDAMLGERVDAAFSRRLAELDRCIVGMMLRIGVTYGIDAARIEAMVDNLLSERMPDGGWNCRKHRRPLPHHSSFHTTLNALEGLREYIEQDSPRATEAKAAEAGALELLAQHRLFRSDHTGNVIRPEFSRFAFPSRWRYDAFRALDYFARAGMPRDPRLGEAIELLRQKRHVDGRWRIAYKYSGRVFFDMEKGGVPSRWNTLRALRILRWWGD
jgi:hypothetical protein